jgi:hypothetical protein
MKPFFIEIQNFWAWTDNANWADKFWVPCLCFPLFKHHFYKKLSLYIHIPYGMGMGFEFGPQRIRDLAFVCPQFVARAVSRPRSPLHIHSASRQEAKLL